MWRESIPFREHGSSIGSLMYVNYLLTSKDSSGSINTSKAISCYINKISAGSLDVSACVSRNSIAGRRCVESGTLAGLSKAK